MQLKFSEKQNNRLQIAVDAATALILSVSFVALWVNSFGLDWSITRFFRGNPLKGFLSAWNQVADALGRSVYLLLPKFSGGVSDMGEPMPQGLFLTLAALLLAGLIFLMIRSRVRVWLVLFLLPWLGLMFCTGIAPEARYMAVFAGALALAWVQMGGEVFRQGTAVAAVVLALLLSIGAGMLPGRIPAYDPGLIADRTGRIMEQVLQSRFGNGALRHGQLNSLSGKELTKARGSMEKRAEILTGVRRDKSKQGLAVSGKALEPYYLRGFIGESYKGNHWDRLPNNVYYDFRGDLYWLNKNGFDGMSQMSSVADLVNGDTGQAALSEEEELVPGQEDVYEEEESGSEKKTISVEVKHGDKGQLYIPYEMVGTEKSVPKGSSNYAGGFLGTTRLFGSKKYKLSVSPGMTSTWTDWVGRLYTAGVSAELNEYFKNESNYNVWCYQKDTEVPEKLREALYEELGEPGDETTSHVDYKEAIALVQDYLAQNYKYSDRFQTMRKGKDFLLKFLKKRKGCDVHYASLATMIFRYYRIPARYVEGYLMTPADTLDGNKKVVLGQSHEHAWTEIYVDGYGWVPVEVTPEYRGIMPEADMTVGLESVSYENMVPETPPAAPDLEDEPLRKGSARKQVKRIALFVVLAVAGILLLVILVLLGRRAWKAFQRRREFNHQVPKHGICAMYGYMIEENLPLSQTAVSIGDAAAFSQLTMEEKHRTMMRDELALGKVKAKRLRREERKQKAAGFRKELTKKLKNLKPSNLKNIRNSRKNRKNGKNAAGKGGRS